MNRHLYGLAALALGGLALLGGACGDDGEPDASAIYSASGEKMAALGSLRITAEEEGFGVELVIEFPDSYELTTSFDGDGEASASVLIKAGDEIYSKGIPFGPPSEDVFVYSEDFFGPAPDFTAFFAALWSGISDVAYAGEEEIDGIATYHLTGTVAPDVLAVLQLDPEEPPAEGASVDVWVGKEDSLWHRYRQVEADETFTATLSNFDDESINIEAPANPLPATQISRIFIESLSDEARGCLRTALGESAFEELSTGARFPTAEEENISSEECDVQ